MHPDIVRETVIAYEFAEVVSTSALEKLILDGDAILKTEASDEMMLAIWEGAFKTRRMTIRCLELLKRTIPC